MSAVQKRIKNRYRQKVESNPTCVSPAANVLHRLMMSHCCQPHVLYNLYMMLTTIRRMLVSDSLK